MKDLNFLKQNIIAHRGMHDIKNNIPENSLEAFKLAVENNYIVELDIHITKDKKIVVFHDDNLKRMTSVDKKIKDLTYEEIEKLHLKNTECKIPLLENVLSLVDSKVPIIIELKYDTKKEEQIDLLMNLLENYKGLYAIKSFDPFRVNYLRKKYPFVIRGQLSSNFKKDKMNILKKIFLKSMIFNKISKPDFISYDVKALPNKKLKKYNLVLAWTIKSKKDKEIALKYVDNIICENIDEIM